MCQRYTDVVRQNVSDSQMDECSHRFLTVMGPSQGIKAVEMLMGMRGGGGGGEEGRWDVRVSKKGCPARLT